MTGSRRERVRVDRDGGEEGVEGREGKELETLDSQE